MVVPLWDSSGDWQGQPANVVADNTHLTNIEPNA
jgi:hypothetical protein